MRWESAEACWVNLGVSFVSLVLEEALPVMTMVCQVVQESRVVQAVVA